MGELALAYKVRSDSTGTRGRAICNARTHHFVADDAGGEDTGFSGRHCRLAKRHLHE